VSGTAEPFLPLPLGRGTIAHFLPHRAPFALLDAVVAFRAKAPRPALCATLLVSADEPVLAGHFPGLPLWPGAYTLEGMGQTCQMLGALLTVCAHAAALGVPSERALRFLVAWDEAARNGQASTEPEVEHLVDAIRAAGAQIAVTAAVEVKFLSPVHMGDRLDYRADLVRALDDFHRFEVEARVGRRAAARGTLTAAVRRSPHPPRESINPAPVAPR